RRRHTRFSRDWSSDVCSSDLRGFLVVLSEKHAHYRPLEQKKRTMFAFLLLRSWCGWRDSNSHELGSPPPQDGVSTNFTTSARSAPVLLLRGRSEEHTSELQSRE